MAVVQLQINSCEVHPLIVSVVDEGVRLDSITRWSKFLVRHGFTILEGAEQHTPTDLCIGTQDTPYRLICLQAIELDQADRAIATISSCGVC